MKQTYKLSGVSAIALAIAGLLGIAKGALAQGGGPTPGAQAASVQVYGVIDLAVGRVESQPPGPPNTPFSRRTTVQNGGLTTSFFGFRGSEPLGGGLRAQFQLEGFFRADTGQSGRFNPPGPPQDPLFSRSAWVGLAGGFGDVKLGLVPLPAWQSMVVSSAMGANSLFSPSFRQQYNGSTRGNFRIDSTMPGGILYTTPNMGGVTGNLALEPSQGIGSSNYSANVIYRAGPLVLTVGAADINHATSPNPAAVVDQSWYLLGGAYDLKVVRLFAQYTDHKDGLTNIKTKTPHLGLTMPISAGQLQVAWARGGATLANGSKSNRTTSSLAYIYDLSRRTSLYGVLSNDKLPAGSANNMLVGIRHTF